MWLSCLLLWPTLTTPLRLSGPAFVSVKMQYHCNSTSINSNFRLIAEYSQLFQWVADHMGPAEFLPSTWFLNLMADYGCGDHVLVLFCDFFLCISSWKWHASTFQNFSDSSWYVRFWRFYARIFSSCSLGKKIHNKNYVRRLYLSGTTVPR